MSSELAVQKALLTALAALTAPAEAGGAPIAVPVYDHTPENAAYPFVSLDGHQVVPADDLASRMDRHTVYLTVWSLYRGKRQAMAILEGIRTALHEAALVLETGVCVSCRVQSTIVRRDADDVTYQGSMTLAVITEP
jgi:hypothetical protein